MKALLSFHYWFNFQPGELSSSGLRYFFGFLVLLFAAVFIFILIRKAGRKSIYNRIWRQAYSFSLTNLIIGVIMLFFFYESVPFLSARFWLLAWGAGIGIWLFFIVRALIRIPKMKEEIAREEEYKKYIP